LRRAHHFKPRIRLVGHASLVPTLHISLSPARDGRKREKRYMSILVLKEDGEIGAGRLRPCPWHPSWQVEFDDLATRRSRRFPGPVARPGRGRHFQDSWLVPISSMNL